MKKFIISLIITAILLALLLSQVSLSELLETFKKFDLRSLAIAFALYTCLYVARAVRFRLFIKKNASIWHLFKIAVAHNFMIRSVPMKVGELSFVEFTKSRFGTARSYGLGSLLAVRMFDLITIVFLATTSLLLIRFSGPRIWLILSIMIALLVLVVLKIDYIVDKLFLLTKKIMKKYKAKEKTLQNAERIKNNILNPLLMIKSPLKFLTIFLASILTWSMGFATFYVLSKAVGLDVPLTVFIPGASVAFFANTLPISVIGDLGIHEGGWAAGFMLLGVNKELAILSGFSVHLVVLAYMILLFLIFGAHEIYTYFKKSF